MSQIINLVGKYTCFLCGSRTTLLRDGKYERWYNYQNNKICQDCFTKTKEKKKDPNSKKRNDRHNKNRLLFKNIRVLLDWNPRTDICSHCGKYDNKTNMHHALGYYIIFPWYGTIELCYSCHAIEEHGVDHSNTVCLLCDSKTTYRKKDGRYDWLSYKDGYICKKCYMKEYNRGYVRKEKK